MRRLRENVRGAVGVRALPALPAPRTAPPRTRVGRWFVGEGKGQQADARTYPWHRVLWLSGVDYFSTLGYQPALALAAAGALAPIATCVLVLVTLLCAVPVYAGVAWRSYAGQGSIAMLESLLPGWGGKLLVLVLLGFAATDFVITITLSAADAAAHAIENPLLHPYLGDARVWVTLALVALLAAVFLRGFREAIGVASLVAIPFVLLNVAVLGRGLLEIARHADLLEGWRRALLSRGDPAGLLLAAAVVFPRLALGLSGFETGVTVMPLIDGGAEADSGGRPIGRIRATRKLLLAAALLMSVLLLASSFVTALLVPAEATARGGPAEGRAIAYLAHQLLGQAFGTAYDLWTISILWFAGASAMAGLLNLIPRYLPRFGMAPAWAAHHRPLVLFLLGVAVLVTLVFRADVVAQGGAYATGVLALMLSAALACAIALGREARDPGATRWRLRLLGLYFWGVTAVFGFTLIDNVAARPSGAIIAAIFIATIILLGAVSRVTRATELRVLEMRFVDQESADRWQSMRPKRVHLVPLRSSAREARERKAAELRKHYAIDGPLAFLHVNLTDNRSEFLAPLRVRVGRAGDDFLIEIFGAIAIANTIAYVSEQLDPRSLFLGLTGKNLMTQSFRYLLLGEGETGLMVYKILLRYWEWTEEQDVRPLIFMMSE